MTDINECAQGILAIADGVHPRSFDLGRERIERLFVMPTLDRGSIFLLRRSFEMNSVNWFTPIVGWCGAISRGPDRVA